MGAMKRFLILILILGAILLTAEDCYQSYEGQGETQKKEAKFSEQQQGRLLNAHPQPILEYSLERVNLIERLERFNDPNKVSYIYLLSDTGQIYTFLPIKGKVSSVNSKLSTGEQIVDDPFASVGNGGEVVESPQEDGSYGTNGDAIFFFAADGTYFEWNGKYLLADRPFQLSEQPLLIYNIDTEE
jgi:hypothetical protein